MPYNSVFISHAHADNEKCDPYAEVLRKRGISLYYDRANPQVGHDLGVSIEHEIEQANTLIVLVTPAALASFWVREEISMFYSLMARDPARLLIPVKLEPCDLPPRLAARWWVDATNQPLEKVLDQLVEALYVAEPVPQDTDVLALHMDVSALTSEPLLEQLALVRSEPALDVSQPAISQPDQPVTPLPASDESSKPGISRRTLLAMGAIEAATLATGIVLWSRTALNTTTIHRSPTLFTYNGHSEWVYSVAWSPGGTRVASASGDGTVQVWNATNGDVPFTYQGHSTEVFAVAWSPGGVRIASAGHDDTVQVWDATDGGHKFIYRGHSDIVFGVSWSPDSTRIASASNDGMQVWDATDGQHKFVYQGQRDGVAVAWSPGGARVASASYDGTVQVWDAANGGHPLTHRYGSAWEDAVSWSPDGTWIASASYDGTVQVWDAANGSSRYDYSGHSDAVNAVVWSPDGTYLASASSDHTVQVWNATSGVHKFTYRGHLAPVLSVAWSPDGTLIASGGQDRTVQVWRAPGP